MQPIIDPQTAAVAAISDIIIRHSDNASICDHHIQCVKKYPPKSSCSISTQAKYISWNFANLFPVYIYT